MMGLDYYAILNINRNSCARDIALAYRKYAIVSHPHRQPYPMSSPENPPEGCAECIDHLPALSRQDCWQFLNEAYDVLSNPLLRHVFDLYGEEGLKHGTPTPKGYVQPYVYHGDHMMTFQLAMGTDSPYADLIDAVTRPPPLYKLADGQTGVRHKDRPVEVPLYLDLKDVYFGGIKKHTFCRHEFIDDSRTATKLCEHVFTIPIRPGVPAGRRITFTGAGDRSVMRLPADIVFVMEDRKDAVYRRNGNDLHWDYEVDLLRSLRGFVIEVVTVDCRRFLVSVLNVVSNGYTKVIENEGLPNEDDPTVKGNLYINFKVNIPKDLPKACKDAIAQVLETAPCTK